MDSRTRLLEWETWVAHSSVLWSGASYSTFFFLIFIGVLLIYHVVLVSAVQQGEWVIHIHIYPLLFRFCSHIGHYRLLSRVPCLLTCRQILYHLSHLGSPLLYLISSISNRKWTLWQRRHWAGVKNHTVWRRVLPRSACVTPDKVLYLL